MQHSCLQLRFGTEMNALLLIQDKRLFCTKKTFVHLHLIAFGFSKAHHLVLIRVGADPVPAKIKVAEKTEVTQVRSILDITTSRCLSISVLIHCTYIYIKLRMFLLYFFVCYYQMKFLKQPTASIFFVHSIKSHNLMTCGQLAGSS